MDFDLQNQDYPCDTLNYQGKNLVGKDFSYQCLVEVNFRSAILDRATFECSNLPNAQFQSGILKRANFKNAILRGAEFEGADLKDANLQGADLYEASFSGAKLQGANLKDCIDIITATFRGTEYDDKTHFPENFNPLEKGLVKKERRVAPQERRKYLESHQVQKKTDIVKSLNKIRSSIKGRQGQKKFRDILVVNYQNRCAITGIKIPGLEAAHIKPYSVCKSNEKLDPKNGLLLRADIHILFDLGLITIQPDYIVKVREPLLSSQYKIYTDCINNKKLNSVKNGIFEPGKEYLEWRYKNYDTDIGSRLRTDMKITTLLEEISEILNW